MELLCSISIMSVIMVSVVESMLDTAHRSWDHKLITTTEEQARAIFDMLAYDLRMMGSGMPLGQASFKISDGTLGTASLPILLDATSTYVSIRVNETGKDTVLTSDYTPNSTNLSFTVLDPSDFSVGDSIYLSDMLRGGSEGLAGTISSISGDTISIDSSYVMSEGAAFTKGCTASRVTTVTYNSPSDWSGITRNNQRTTEVIAVQSTFSIRYLDGSGNELTLPLTAAVIDDSLAQVELTISVRTTNPLRDGSIYTAILLKRIALRNLNYNRG